MIPKSERVFSLKRVSGYMKKCPTHVIRGIAVLPNGLVQITYIDEFNNSEETAIMSIEYAEANNLINFEFLKQFI